jgi:hypothetical protein
LKGQYAWKRNPWVFATTFEIIPLKPDAAQGVPTL